MPSGDMKYKCSSFISIAKQTLSQNMAGTYMLKFRHIRYGVYIILVIWFITHYFNSESRNKDSRPHEDDYKPVSGPRRLTGIKTIQWYDLHHNGNGLRCRSHVVNFNKCEYSNCKVSDHYLVHPQDDTSTPEGPLQADAVIFQGNHIEGLLPPIRRDNNQVIIMNISITTNNRILQLYSATS